MMTGKIGVEFAEFVEFVEFVKFVELRFKEFVEFVVLSGIVDEKPPQTALMPVAACTTWARPENNSVMSSAQRSPQAMLLPHSWAAPSRNSAPNPMNWMMLAIAEAHMNAPASVAVLLQALAAVRTPSAVCESLNMAASTSMMQVGQSGPWSFIRAMPKPKSLRSEASASLPPAARAPPRAMPMLWIPWGHWCRATRALLVSASASEALGPTPRARQCQTADRRPPLAPAWRAGETGLGRWAAAPGPALGALRLPQAGRAASSASQKPPQLVITRHRAMRTG
mmetsp:Transcript_126923/g.353435  ORF Transcript_126923/g.353435 Transcript_126923/m.353435 type:complete len:282 (-) Transcript_126923:66-911(-)